MPRRARSFIVTALLLVAMTSVGALAEVGSSLTAMDCCAKTHNQCAGIKSADDCCRGMGHAESAAPLATVDASHVVVLPLAVIVASGRGAVTRSGPEPPFTFTFTRPHDPPHLHGFSLLI